MIASVIVAGREPNFLAQQRCGAVRFVCLLVELAGSFIRGSRRRGRKKKRTGGARPACCTGQKHRRQQQQSHTDTTQHVWIESDTTFAETGTARCYQREDAVELVVERHEAAAGEDAEAAAAQDDTAAAEPAGGRAGWPDGGRLRTEEREGQGRRAEAREQPAADGAEAAEGLQQRGQGAQHGEP